MMFSFGDDIHIHATGVKEEITYKLLDGQGDALREQMKAIAQKYGIVKHVEFQ